jgi:hypothetical protein
MKEILTEIIEQSKIKKIPNQKERMIQKEIFYSKVSKGKFYLLNDAPSFLLEDKEFMVYMVKKDPRSSKFILDILTEDEEFCKNILEHDVSFFERCPQNIRFDSSIAIPIILKIPKMMLYSSDEIRSNKKLVSLCVMTHGNNLQYASEELRDDEEIVYLAVEKDNGKTIYSPTGYIYNESLKYASERLQNNEEIVLKAIKSNDHQLKHINKELLKNVKFVSKGIEVNPRIYKFLPLDIQEMNDIFKRCAEKDYSLNISPNRSESIERLPWNL